MIGPELMSSRLNTTGAPGMQRGEVTQQNSLTQEMQGLAVTGVGNLRFSIGSSDLEFICIQKHK